MKSLAVCTALLLTSLTLAAQDSSRNKIILLPPQIPVCPISMQAHQGVWDHTIRVRDGQQQQISPFGQRLSLTLVDQHPSRILSATVRVRGLNGRSHMVQAVGSANDDSNATRTMSIKFSANPDNSVTGDLYAPGFTSIMSVELLQVTYEDGSTWKISGSNVCRVAPDPMMLIAGH